MNVISKIVTALLLVAAMSGCATTHNNPVDPFEGFNRAVFDFNDGVDRVALKPAAIAYRNILPSFVQTGVGNFFGNLADVWTSVNNLLQGKVERGLNDMLRVAVNSTLGFGGLLDIGSEAGLQKHKVDFGQTLGVWGVKSGPYVVLPLLGPSTLRDTVALPVDFVGNPVTYAESSRVRIAASLVRAVDLRASVLDASSLIEDAAIDRYEFIRDAYLQRRESKIRDGESAPRKQASLMLGGDEDNTSAAVIESKTVPQTVESSVVTTDNVSAVSPKEDTMATAILSSNPVLR